MIRKCQKPYSTLSSIVEKHIIISNLALEMRAEILIEASQPIQAVQVNYSFTYYLLVNIIHLSL